MALPHFVWRWDHDPLPINGSRGSTLSSIFLRPCFAESVNGWPLGSGSASD